MLKAKIGLKISNLLIYNHIEKYIEKGMEKGAKNASKMFVQLARQHLKDGTDKYKGKYKSKGKKATSLSNSIKYKNASTGLTGYARWDVIVDSRYGVWIEYGSDALEGIPWQHPKGNYTKGRLKGQPKKPKPGYKTSSFKGHRFITKTITDMKHDGFLLKLVMIEIVRSLLSSKSVSGLKRLI